MGAIPDHRTNTAFPSDTPKLDVDSYDEHLEAHITDGPSTPTVEVEQLRREITRLKLELQQQKENNKYLMEIVPSGTSSTSGP